MTRYKIGEHTFNRKNTYMPCAIAADVDDMPAEEQAAVYRRTYWADNITNAEWPVVLGHDGITAYVKSKLKKKAAGWLVALGRIAYLHPTLAREICTQARAMYADQIREEYPWADIATGLAGLPLEDNRTVVLQVVRNDDDGNGQS
jgi:hypothetical protein